MASAEKLKELYYNPKTGLGNRAFAIRARTLGFSSKEISDFLSSQEVYQINKQNVQEPHHFPIWGVPYSYQADTIDMGDKSYKGWRYVLTIIDINTRKAYAQPFKQKSSEAAWLIGWLKEHKPKCMQIDQGTEFSKKVDAFCTANNINLRRVATGASTDQGKVERFNGTLRRLITLYCSAYKNDDWVKVLQDLMENYNSRFCLPIHMAPDDADEKTCYDSNFKQYRAAQVSFDQFAIGERVRKLISTKGAFTKGRQTWSKQVLTITHIQHHEFTLSDGSTVKSWDVQYVPDGDPAGFDVFDTRVPTEVVKKRAKVVRDLRKEGLDVPKIKAKEIPKIAQMKFGKKFYYGKVKQIAHDKFEVAFNNGQTQTFTEEEVYSRRFPLTAADKKNYAKVLNSL